MANWWLQAESLLVVCHAGNDIYLSVDSRPGASGPFPQRHDKLVRGTKKAKTLCLIEMFSVFFRPFSPLGNRLHMVSLVHLLTFKTWRVEMERAFWRSVKVFLCSVRLEYRLQTCLYCAKYTFRFWFETFQDALLWGWIWKKIESSTTSIIPSVTAKQRLQRDNWFKDVGQTILTKVSWPRFTNSPNFLSKAGKQQKHALPSLSMFLISGLCVWHSGPFFV